MTNIHCICHWLAWHVQIKAMITNSSICLNKTWLNRRNSSKTHHIDQRIRLALKCKEFDTISNMRQEKIVKRVKTACRSCWISLHSGVHAVIDEYEGIVRRSIPIFYQNLFSPKLKWSLIIIIKHGIYELPHESQNGLRFKILEN